MKNAFEKKVVQEVICQKEKISVFKIETIVKTMPTELFWTLLVFLLCTIVFELFLITIKIGDWIEVSKIRQDSLFKMQDLKIRYVSELCLF